MDKLWASAWRRNQTEIGALNKTIMALKASSEKKSKNLSNENSDNNTTIGLVKEQLENQASLLKQLNEKFGQVNNFDADFEQQLASLREKLISTALANNDLTNQVDDLRRRILEAEKKANSVKTLPAPNITPA
jgi:chromosome segregation ATPase